MSTRFCVNLGAHVQEAACERFAHTRRTPNPNPKSRTRLSRPSKPVVTSRKCSPSPSSLACHRQPRRSGSSPALSRQPFGDPRILRDQLFQGWRKGQIHCHHNRFLLSFAQAERDSQKQGPKAKLVPKALFLKKSKKAQNGKALYFPGNEVAKMNPNRRVCGVSDPEMTNRLSLVLSTSVMARLGRSLDSRFPS